MAKKGGDIRQVIIDGTEYDAVGGGGQYTALFSGFTNENTPTGNGKMHTNQNRKLGGFDGLQLSVMTDEYALLQSIADDARVVPVAITTGSGSVHAGQLAVEGDLNFDAVAGTVELTMRGPVYEEQ